MTISEITEAVHSWIREDAPITIKMRMEPEHVAALVRRLAALRAPAGGGSAGAGVMQWRPIATAPRDGSPFWAYLNQTGTRKVRWLSAEAIAEVEGGDPARYQEGFYEVENEDEEWGPRWWLPLDAIPADPTNQPGSPDANGTEGWR